MPDFEDEYEGAELDLTDPYDIEHQDPEDNDWEDQSFYDE